MDNVVAFKQDVARKIYIAGPMSGYESFNFPAFYAAEELLADEGWDVYNPADKEEEDEFSLEAALAGDTKKAISEGFDFREAYLWDISCVIDCDAIYMLKGWEQSPGARGEHAVAVAMQKHYPEYRIIYE